MILVGTDVYLPGGRLAADYPYLRFMARAMGGVAVGLMNETIYPTLADV